MSRTKRTLLLLMGVLCLGMGGAVLTPSSAYAGASLQDQPCEAGDACEDFVQKYINPFITLLTVSIGIIAAISIVVAGIQYASAGADPSKVQKAKSRIGQTLIGLLAYLFLFSLLNYFVPGGFLQ